MSSSCAAWRVGWGGWGGRGQVTLVGVAHASYSLARLVGAGSEDGRDGVCIADGAQVFLAGGLRGDTRWLLVAAKTPSPRAAVPGTGAAAEHGEWAGGGRGGTHTHNTHQRGGSRLLGLLAQVVQHLVHLRQLLSTDVLCVCGDKLGVCGVNATLGLLGNAWGGAAAALRDQPGQEAWCWGEGSPCWGQQAGHWVLQGDKNHCQKHSPIPSATTGGQHREAMDPCSQGQGGWDVTGNTNASSPVPPTQPWAPPPPPSVAGW